MIPQIFTTDTFWFCISNTFLQITAAVEGWHALGLWREPCRVKGLRGAYEPSPPHASDCHPQHGWMSSDRARVQGHALERTNSVK
jgi:hypothetical protein